MTDERAKITVAKMAAISDIVAPEKEYIQYSAQGAVTIMAGCVIAAVSYTHLDVYKRQSLCLPTPIPT